MTDPLLEVDSLVKTFRTRSGDTKRAVDGVSLSIQRGETFGLVGESGSGKSTLGRCVLRLLEPDAGKVRFDGTDMGTLSPKALRDMRSRIQVVFQDPHASLNRRHTVGRIVEAPLLAHRIGNASERRRRVAELLAVVQLPESYAERLPGQLSGGQAQRVAIARALALNPDFVVLDEAVSALDMSVRAQILNLLGRLQQDLGLTFLFISHDLSVVRYLCHRVAVMKQGRLVEIGTREEVFARPQDAYTRELLAAVPIPDPAVQRDRMRTLVEEGEVDVAEL
jgi:ABC-type oligopeptide transport system ATPase subunit